MRASSCCLEKRCSNHFSWLQFAPDVSQLLRLVDADGTNVMTEHILPWESSHVQFVAATLGAECDCCPNLRIPRAASAMPSAGVA